MRRPTLSCCMRCNTRLVLQETEEESEEDDPERIPVASADSQAAKASHRAVVFQRESVNVSYNLASREANMVVVKII